MEWIAAQEAPACFGSSLHCRQDCRWLCHVEAGLVGVSAVVDRTSPIKQLVLLCGHSKQPLSVVTLALQPTVCSVWLQANESEGEAVPPQKPTARRPTARKPTARKRSTRPQPAPKRARSAEPSRLDANGEVVRDATLRDPGSLL